MSSMVRFQYEHWTAQVYSHDDGVRSHQRAISASIFVSLAASLRLTSFALASSLLSIVCRYGKPIMEGPSYKSTGMNSTGMERNLLCYAAPLPRSFVLAPSASPPTALRHVRSPHGALSRQQVKLRLQIWDQGQRRYFYPSFPYVQRYVQDMFQMRLPTIAHLVSPSTTFPLYRQDLALQLLDPVLSLLELVSQVIDLLLASLLQHLHGCEMATKGMISRNISRLIGQRVRRTLYRSFSLLYLASDAAASPAATPPATRAPAPAWPTPRSTCSWRAAFSRSSLASCFSSPSTWSWSSSISCWQSGSMP